MKQTLPPEIEILLRRAGEADRRVPWSTFVADNFGDPVLVEAEAFLLEGRVFDGGGGAAPAWSVQLTGVRPRPILIDEEVTIRGLTLWRPWSGSIVHGPKRIENRGWAPSQQLVDRGLWIAIHGGSKWDRDGAEFLTAHWTIAASVVMLAGERTYDILDERQWPARAISKGIVGVARVRRAVPAGDPAVRTDPFAFGPFCWMLEDVRALPEPIPCKGAQGLWVLPPEVLERVHPWCLRPGKP